MIDSPIQAVPVLADDVVSPWRILVVEDSADDAELIRIELAQSGLTFEFRCVDSELQLLQALAAFTPQLVLSDVNMPGFSGERAFEIVNAHATGVRFVFLSGSPLGDEMALQLGPAPDAWLLKEDLAQLPTLVRTLLAAG